MKYRYILLFMVAMLCSGLSGCGKVAPAQVIPQIEEKKQPISFQYSHTAGMKTAQQERKPTLTFFSVPDNVGSQRMMETTFCDAEIKRLADWLVCIQVDGSQEPALCESLSISSFPTTILSNAAGTEICRLVGKQTPAQLAVQIHVLLQTTVLRSPVVAGR